MSLDNFLFTTDKLMRSYDIIMDFYDNKVIHHKFDTGTGFTLSALEMRPRISQARLAIIPGRGECEHKYAELLYCLSRERVHTCVCFVRGQGASSGTLPDNKRSYIEDFSLYSNDIEFLLDKLGFTSNYGMMAFSLGGLIALHFTQYHENIPDKLALIAPFIYPYFPVPNFLAKMLISLGNTFAKKSLVATQTDYQYIAFEENDHTHCKERYEIYHDYFAKHPGIACGGSTYAFVYQCMKAQAQFRQSRNEFRLPILCQYAGEDKVVDSRYTVDLFSRHSKDKYSPQIVGIEGSYHDVLNELDDIRNPSLYRAFKFLF